MGDHYAPDVNIGARPSWAGDRFSIPQRGGGAVNCNPKPKRSARCAVGSEDGADSAGLVEWLPQH